MSAHRSFRRAKSRRGLQRQLRAERLEHRLLLTSVYGPELLTPATVGLPTTSDVQTDSRMTSWSAQATIASADLGEGEGGGDLQFAAAVREGAEWTDLGAAVAADAAGNVYVSGIVEGDAVVAKYNAAGTEVWVRSLEGWFGTEGADVAVDGEGNVYATGSFIGNLRVAPSGPNLFSSPNRYSVYVVKHNGAGNLVWARQFTGNNNIDSFGLAVDGNKNVYVTGNFHGTIDFDPGAGTASLTSNPDAGDIFVAKLDPSGNYGWATRAGGNGDDFGRDIAVDPMGNVVITGSFSGSADFDPGSGSFNLASSGWEDMFLWKLNSSGSLLWAKAIGGAATEFGNGVAVDLANGIYLTGHFYGDLYLNQSPGNWPLQPKGNSGDVLVVKYDGQGQFVWADGLGGTSDDQGVRVAVDAFGSVFVTGVFQGTADFDPGAGTANLTSVGVNDIFVARFNRNTGGLIWAGRMGGGSQEQPLGLAVDGAGNVYTTGYFQSTADFDPGTNFYNLTSAGAEDLFVSKLSYSLNMPNVSINQAAGQPDPTNVSDINFTVVFTKPVTGFQTGDVQLGGTAPGNLVGTVVPSGNGTTYTVTVTGMTGSGTVIATVPAGVAADADGNGNSVSTSTDNIVLYDVIGPTGTPADPPADGTTGYAVINGRGYFDVAFADTGGAGLNVSTILDNEPEFSLLVNGNPAPGIVVNGAPTLVSGNTYRYFFTGEFGISLVELDFLPVSFFDLAGNPNQVQKKGFWLTDVPVLSINDVAVTEGNSGSVNATFTVSLSYAAAVPVTVAYSTADSSAQATWDYSAKTGTLTFAPGVTSQTVSVAVLGDQLDEFDETFSVVLSNAQNAGIADNQGIGTIVDDDAAPALSINSVKVTEPNPPGVVNAVFTVSLSKASGREVTVDCDSSDGTAVEGSDYQGINELVTFAPGQTQQTVVVPVLGDTLDELTETFFVDLANPDGATIAQSRGTGTISDDDPPPAVNIQDVTVNEDSGTADFLVSLSTASGQPVTVKFATGNGSAKAPGDFTAISGVVAFPPGTVDQLVSVPIVDDSVLELTETFSVKLSKAAGAKLGRKAATGTILDDEPKPTVSISDGVAVEGAKVAFTVSLSAPSALPASVKYTTLPGTATSNADFKPASGTVTFKAGTTTQTISISTVNDRITEGDETFQVVLSSPSGADPGSMSGTGTIMDDDIPGITITPTAGIVTTESGGKATLNIKLNTQPTANVTLNLMSTDTSEGVLSTSSVTITPADWTKAKTVTVTGVDDGMIDGDIPYQIVISSVTTADPIYGDPGLSKPVVNAVNRDNDKLGAGKVVVTVVGNGYVVDTTGQIDTRAGKNIATYPPDAFPYLIAKNPAGGFPSNVVWVPEVCWDGIHSCPLINSDYANGLAVTVYITPLMATSSRAAKTDAPSLAAGSPEIAGLVQTAVQYWAAAGVDSTQLTRLTTIDWQVVDLPGRMLGTVRDNTLLIDVHAAGHGWFIDATPRASEEFVRTTATSLCASPSSPAARRMDLLTVLAHEIGHVLGLDDVSANTRASDVMAAVLAPGTRRVSWATAVDGVFARDML